MKRFLTVALILLFVCIPLQLPDNKATVDDVAGVFTTTSVKLLMSIKN